MLRARVADALGEVFPDWQRARVEPRQDADAGSSPT
jgi:hypothetical protein